MTTVTVTAQALQKLRKKIMGTIAKIYFEQTSINQSIKRCLTWL